MGALTTVAFNPALLSKQDLVRGFVARQDLLERLMDDLRRVHPGTPPQHQLLIGQRGLGKTTMLRRLAFAIEDDPQLSAAWVPLVFPEEQYNIKNLADFWLNCADALSDALDRMGSSDEAELLDKEVGGVSTDPKKRSSAALGLLVDAANRCQKGLVLLVDNLDIVLDRLDQSEEWEFRRVISDERKLFFIGASSRALEALYEHGRAFYDYFQVHDLKGFGDEEMFAVLRRLGEENQDAQVLRLINEKPARVRALRVLTGGNPRTLILLYRVLAEDRDGDAQRDLEQLLDLYTPLYKARFEEMAQQAQQIVDAMAIHWDPLTAGELAEKLTPLSVNQVSAQLKRLEDFGTIEKTPWFGEKKAAFQIAERFFNIWYLMRASRRVRRRLIWLVKFLEAWFEHEELIDRGKKYLQRSPEQIGPERYTEMAFAYSQVVRDKRLRRGLETAALRASLSLSVRDLIDFSDLAPEVQDRRERMQRLNELRSQVLELRIIDIDPAELWRVLGGSPQLSLEEKARVVQELPALEPVEVKRLYSKLKRAQERLIFVVEIYGRSDEVARLYGALATGEMTDAFDLEGALAIAESGCKFVPLAALSSRTNRWVNPEKLSPSDLTRAEDGYLSLISDSDYRTKALYGLGNLLKDHLGRYEEAEEAYRKAIELDPATAYPWNGLGNLLQDHLGRYTESEEAYRKAIELDPAAAYPLNGLGGLLQDHLGRFEEAEEAYRKAIQLVPLASYPWKGLGNLLQSHLGRYQEAEEAYRKAIELDPLDADPWLNMGSVLQVHLGRYEEAEDAYRKAIEMDPLASYPWNNLGNLLQVHLGRYEEAEDAYRKAIELDPLASNPWNNLGTLLQNHRGRYEESEGAYRKAIELAPLDADPRNNLGNLLQDHLKRYEEAGDAYRKAIELDSRNALPWMGLGDLLKRDRNRYNEAEQAYRKSIELDPRYAYPWGQLAGLFGDDAGRQKEKLEALQRAAELEPKSVWWRRQLLRFSKTLAEGPSLAVARAAVSRQLEFVPDDNEVKFTLAGLFALDGDWTRSALLFEELALEEDQRVDIWAFGSAVSSGHTLDLITILEKTGAHERWRPMYEALRALRAGSDDYLNKVAPEIRAISQDILKEIMLRRKTPDPAMPQ